MRCRQKVTPTVYSRRQTDSGNLPINSEVIGTGNSSAQVITLERDGATNAYEFPETHLADFGIGVR